MSPRKQPAGDAEAPLGSKTNSWAEYVQRHLDTLGWSNVTLSRAANIDRSLIGRWLNDGTQPTIESIRAVSRAFGRDVREGLIAAGIFTEQEMHAPAPTAPDMRLLDDDQLLEEVKRRMEARRVGTPTVTVGEGHEVTVPDQGNEVIEVREQNGVDDIGQTEEGIGEAGPANPESLVSDAKPMPKARHRRRQKPEAVDRVGSGD